MAVLARLRREELDGFVEGPFGDKESLDLPERAHRALGALAEIRAMLDGAQLLAEDPTKPAPPGEIAATLGHFRELTRIAEHEMLKAVLSCPRAPEHMLTALPARRPALHRSRADVRTLSEIPSVRGDCPTVPRHWRTVQHRP